MKRTLLEIAYQAAKRAVFGVAADDPDVRIGMQSRMGKETIACGDATSITLTVQQSLLVYLRVSGSNDNDCRIIFLPPPDDDGVLTPVWVENLTDGDLEIANHASTGTTVVIPPKIDTDEVNPDGTATIFRAGCIVTAAGVVAAPGYTRNA
jgi:hypothetical protein